jgi:hypothetical protein
LPEQSPNFPITNGRSLKPDLVQINTNAQENFQIRDPNFLVRQVAKAQIVQLKQRMTQKSLQTIRKRKGKA